MRMWLASVASQGCRIGKIVAGAVAVIALTTCAFGQSSSEVGGEANLKLPDLSQVNFLGMDGHRLLLIGILFCVFGLGFGLVIYTRPKTQKRIPISSNRWPSIPRKLTCDRSGSFRFASPPTSEEDWPKAHVVRAMTATAPATIFPIRHPWDATLASQMRIGIPPDENLSDVHEFKSHIPVHSMTKRSLPERQGAHCRSSEHASTARLEKDC